MAFLLVGEFLNSLRIKLNFDKGIKKKRLLQIRVWSANYKQKARGFSCVTVY